MVSQKIVTFYEMIEKGILRYYPLILALLILSAAVIVTFTQENAIVGFEKGYDEPVPEHHGAVSSNTLAIIANATLENNFVGYAVRYKDDSNTIVYDYFDRYPVFFSAVFNRVLALRTKLSSQIYLAKQVMNLIFVATLIVAFLICDKIIKNKLLSLTAVLFAFANRYLLFYKDMVHFDQPALFGMLLLTYAIALYKIDGLKWPVAAATFIAIALGRGYASYAVLGLWLVIEAVLILRTRDLSFGQRVKNVLKHRAFILILVGIAWGAGLLSYNIIIEAQKRDIPLLSTSIIDSAGRRLALNSQFNDEYAEIIDWPGYAQVQISRIIKWTLPVKWPNPDFWISLFLLALMIFIIVKAMRHQTAEKRIITILLAFSGFIWMTLMRNLAAFHDYTSMYFLGLSIAFYLSLLVLLRPSRYAVVFLALVGMVVYSSAIIQVRDLHEMVGGNASEYTYDFMRIEKALSTTGNNVYMASKVPYGINAADFYLSDQYLAAESISDYVISDIEGYLPDNLTPDNQYMFLYKR